MLRENRVERLVDKCGLARAADASYHNKFAQRKLCRNAFKVVATTAGKHQVLISSGFLCCDRVATYGTVKIAGGECICLQQFCGSALEDYFATFAASPRTDIDNVVGAEHHIAVVLNDDNGIPKVA